MPAIEGPRSSDRAAHCCRPVRRSFLAGERQDRIGADCYIAASAQMGDQAPTTATTTIGVCANDSHDLAVELEIYFGVWQETGPFADFGRDRDLPFGSDTHTSLPFL